MIYLLITILLFTTIIILLIFGQPQFGKLPSRKRLAGFKSSPNFKNGAFQNRSLTPNLTEGVSYSGVMREFFFGKYPRKKPTIQLPSVKTDLKTLDPGADILVWFGHSSYFMQVDGKRILVDPVLSGSASPFSIFSVNAFEGSDIYKPGDLPAIDFLFITHDHWDHLDYKTIKKIEPQVSKVICGLGTGEHLEYWGYPPAKIIEKDWDETVILNDGFRVHTTTARHFSGRSIKRNASLWMSFVLQTPTLNIFIGGDSGYDAHFAEIGNKFGPFDLAILENGQYDKSWKYIHLMPEEVLQAGADLKAKTILPVHSSKFSISNHPWDDPLHRITAANDHPDLRVITPMIGEPVSLKNADQEFKHWWRGIE